MNTFTEKLGIAQETIGYMQNTDNAAALKANNFDVTPHVTRVQAKLDKAKSLFTEHSALEVQYHKKTAELKIAAQDLYIDTSGMIDAMGGMLGKGSLAADKLKTIRSRVRNHPAPTPAPATAVKN